MKHLSIRRLPSASLALLVLLAAAGCDKKAPPSKELLPMDKVAPSPVGTSQDILQKTFSLKKSENFPFEIPAHAVRPHLHGIFESFVGELHGASDETANISFMIMNEEQYADLIGNRPSEALLSVEDSHNQAVNLDLPASLDHPVKYYLVFHNASKGNKVIRAQFRIDF